MYHAAVTNIPVALTTMLIALLCVSDHRAAAAAPSAQAATAPTAAQIVERIKSHVGVPWQAETVDTFKAGDPDTRVTGVAVTMMATLDVLQRAVKSRPQPGHHARAHLLRPSGSDRTARAGAGYGICRQDGLHQGSPPRRVAVSRPLAPPAAGRRAGRRAAGARLERGGRAGAGGSDATRNHALPARRRHRSRLDAHALRVVGRPDMASRRSRSLLAPRGSRATAKRSSAPTSRCW